MQDSDISRPSGIMDVVRLYSFQTHAEQPLSNTVVLSSRMAPTSKCDFPFVHSSLLSMWTLLASNANA